MTQKEPPNDRADRGLNVSVGNATYVTPQMGRVLITQLKSPIPATESRIISKILIKAVVNTPKGKSKNEPKTFTLRNVDVASINTCDKLKELIKSQLCNDVVREFYIGYYHGSTVVSIRTAEDLNEIWQEVKKGTKVILWCDSLRQTDKSGSKKRRHDSDSDEKAHPSKKISPAAKERENEVEEIINNLAETHSRKFTQMQYRIWAEMYITSYHKSLTDPPKTSMFERAGGADSSHKRKAGQDSVVEKQLSTALSSTPSTSLATSPPKAIEGRSKCYKQLVDLKNLKTSGILSEDEYKVEKDAIMASLKKFH